MCHTSLAPSWEKTECGYWRKLIRELPYWGNPGIICLRRRRCSPPSEATFTSSRFNFHIVCKVELKGNEDFFMLCCDIDTKIILPSLLAQASSFFNRSKAIYHFLWPWKREWQKEKLALAWNRAAFIGHLCYGLLKQPFPLFLYVFFFFYACAAVPTMPFKSFCNRPLGWPCPSSFNHGVFYFRLQSSSWRRLWVKQRGFFACLCLLQPREMLSFANLRSAV